MSHIDKVRSKIHPDFFNHLSGEALVRILDTPHVWGMPFGREIMPTARARTKDFERSVIEIIQKARYRCDVASLNSPDPAWAKVILEAMDAALTKRMGRPADKPTQFRFLFGQTPMILKDGTSPNLIDFQGALIRLVRARHRQWEVMPEIWMGKFYRLRQGIVSGFAARITSAIWDSPEDDSTTKMTWNHSKIIAVDGAEALVGGHNLNMDLFTSYPPVHDVSVIVHGDAAHGSQLFLNRMWECKTDLLTKEYLDTERFAWRNGDDDNAQARRPVDPLNDAEAAAHMARCNGAFAQVHRGGQAGGQDRGGAERRLWAVPARARDAESSAAEIRAEDLQTLRDIEEPVFEERRYNTYANLHEYKKATRILSVGKYWTGPNQRTDYQKASEIMKEVLIKGANRVLRLSQMDLVSAWKKKWSSHVVCHWLMDALIANDALTVQVVVSPLDAGAGAEGDQYSFGSGARRTFDLIKYYMTHDVETDAELPDGGRRARALERLHIAPLYFTNMPPGQTIEGQTYVWPALSPEGYTATLKQPPLDEQPPRNGIIGDAKKAVVMASGAFYPKVPSAPGNHAKIMIVDDESYVVGSDNLYPGFLSEFNYLVEGESAVNEMLKSYWKPLWMYSSAHCVNPNCQGGCKAAGV